MNLHNRVPKDYSCCLNKNPYTSTDSNSDHVYIDTYIHKYTHVNERRIQFYL